ncbi:hypothetical protein ILYODFUR_028755 [Ilyodon furcidens]|uniref:Fringe-like glycosyltransferase domain-containing protein n=1 Tax=Ilyodon furcidens TaxID=33524 RepID=A0ABV0T124_9TELE
MSLCVSEETGPFLVRHRRSGVVSEPWPCSEDETLGQVNSHIQKSFPVTIITLNLLFLVLSISEGRFMATAEHIRLPDDCTVGYIVEALLGGSLTRSALFHSHLENLGLVSDIHNQVNSLQPRQDATD